jgi:hypothetical protein
MTSAVNKAFVFAKKPTTINHDIQRLFLTTKKSEFTLFGEFLVEILNKNKTQSRRAQTYFKNTKRAKIWT